MQLLNTRFLSATAVLAAIMLAGCGGGGNTPNPDNQGPFTFDGNINDDDFFDGEGGNDRHYDIFQVDATSSGTAEVNMTSNDLDSQLYIYKRNSNGNFGDPIAEDDDSGDGPDAVVRFDVRRGDIYRVIVTSSRAREFGDYRVFFSREFGRPLIVPNNNGNRTAPGFVLPKMKVKGEIEKRAAQ